MTGGLIGTTGTFTGRVDAKAGATVNYAAGNMPHSGGGFEGLYVEGGSHNAAINNYSTALKLSPNNASNRTATYYSSGIMMMHLHPDTWNASYYGGHAYIGLSLHSTPGQEHSALVFATNPSSGTHSMPVERMRIIHDGEIGIGTITPTGTLHVYGAGHPTSKPVFKVQGSSGSLLEIQDTFEGTLFSANDKAGIPILKAKAAGYITMNHVSASQMEAIPSPELGALLFNTTSGSYSVFDGIEWRNIANTSAGDVGIGIASPIAKLHVRGGSASHIAEFDSVGGEDRFQFGGVADSADAYLSIFNSAQAQKIKLHSNATSYIQGGNLAIGSTSAAEALSVTGNIAVTGTVDGIDIAARDAVLTSTTSTASTGVSNAATAQGQANTATTNAATAQSTANSATTTANAALARSGGTMTGNITVPNGFVITDSAAFNDEIIFDQTNRRIDFQIDNATNLTVGNGYVGVKDTTPSYDLDVTGTIRATADVIAYSDKRVKENIETIENPLEKVKGLRGVSYNRIDIEDKSKKIGVIAQEVLDVLPEVVDKDVKGKYSVAYGNMVGLLIESIKEQQKQIEYLKKEVKELRSGSPK
jgi:hypothetical protein